MLHLTICHPPALYRKDGRYFAASYVALTIGGISGYGARFADRPLPLDPALEWTDITEMATLTVAARRLRFFCGEGAQGVTTKIPGMGRGRRRLPGEDRQRLFVRARAAGLRAFPFSRIDTP